MSKTTFLGYVPSLKEKHEATIVEGKAIESKGGSIRYTLRGEYKGRKTLPKTVTKADFEGLYGFDAKEAEAVIISGLMPRNKDEDRIHIKDVMEEDGFIPKKIIEVHDVQKIPSVAAGIPLGKNYSNHHKLADTVGSPSPASVEPPAPSETPFPQEPSNENFSAETKAKDGDIYYHIYTYPQKWIDEDGWEGFYTDGKRERGYDFGLYEEIKDTYQEAVNYVDERNKESPLAFAAIWEWDATEGKQKGTLDGEYTDNYNEIINTDPDSLNETEVKEAFGLFGDKDEEEEEEEKPKEQEFTVVLQEGDKLELTDIEEDDTEVGEPKEEDNGEDEENDEKEAEMDKGILMICPSCDETVPEYSSCMSCGQQFGAEEGTRTFVVSSVDYETDDEDQDELDLPQDFTITLDGSDIKHLEQMEKEYNEEYPGEWPDYEMQEIADLMVDTISDESGWLVEGFYFEELMPDGTLKSFNAVQAKITRPVKEEEKEEEEKEEEGMSTLMKVGLGVGALAVGAAILGAEDEGESDYWAGENAEWRAETAETFSASGDVSVGQKRIQSRKDYDIENEYDTDLEVGDIDLDDYNDELENEFNDELVDAIRESVDDSMPISDGETGSGSVDVDTEIDITVPVSGEVNFDWTSHEENEEEDVDSEWDAEDLTSSEFVPFDQITAEIQEEWDETTIPVAADYEPSNEPTNSNFSAEVDKEFYENVSGSLCPNCGRDGDLGHFSTLYWCDDCGNEGCDGCTDDCDCETKEAESKNMNWVIGLTVLGVGVAALGYSDKILALFDRFKK